MINAVYNRPYNRLTVSGHAGSAEHGRDLVCAAVSAITYTLAANVDRLEKQGQVRAVGIKFEDGYAEIKCKCPKRYKSVVTVIFDSVVMGIAILAQQYPDFVTFEVRG